jgi:hypothetical protein
VHFAPAPKRLPEPACNPSATETDARRWYRATLDGTPRQCRNEAGPARECLRRAGLQTLAKATHRAYTDAHTRLLRGSSSYGRL